MGPQIDRYVIDIDGQTVVQTFLPELTSDTMHQLQSWRFNRE
jgi:hypothetical protein